MHCDEGNDEDHGGRLVVGCMSPPDNGEDHSCLPLQVEGWWWGACQDHVCLLLLV